MRSVRAPRRPLRAGFAAALALLGAAALTGASASGGAGPAKTGPSWETLPPSKLARTEVVAARAGGLIYVVGGFAGGGVAQSAAVERYDPRAREWTSTAPLPTTLNHAGAVGWRGDLYVFGGFIAAPVVGADRLSDRLFRYDAATDSWSELASAPVPRSSFAAGVIGGRLYVAGGSTPEAQKTNRLDVYSFRRDRWREGPPMTVAREHLAGAVAGRAGSKRLYALGGRDVYGSDNYSTVERYDPRRRRWRRLPDMGVPHGGFGAAGVGRRVVAVGGERPGEGATGTIPVAELYSPRLRRWTRLPDLPTPRHGLGVAAVGRTVFALEGGPITFASVSNAAEALTLPGRRPR